MNDDPTKEVKRPKQLSRYPHFGLVTLGLTLLVIVSFSYRTRNLGFLGWDSYPILAASQVAAGEDLVEVMARPLGDGLIGGAAFYRPLLSLSLALEQWLWGLDAWPYLLFNIVIFGLAALVLFVWCRELVGGLHIVRGGWMATVATLFFVFHPVSSTVVPFLPRRTDLLCTLFVLAALWLDGRGRFRRSRLALGGSLAATAVALSAKESAVLLPVLIFSSRFLFSASARRWRDSLGGFRNHMTIVAIVLIPRWFIVGGFARPASFEGLHPVKTWALVLAGVAVPGEDFASRPWLAFIFLVIGCLGMLWSTRWRKLLSPAHWRLAVFGAVWSMSFGVFYGLVGRVSPWYLLIVAAGAAISFGTAIDLAIKGLEKVESGRLPGLVTITGGALLLVSFVSNSPLVRDWNDIDEADRRTKQFLENFDRRLEAASLGETIDLGRCPRAYKGIAMVTPNSIRGWVRLENLEDRVEILEGRDESPRRDRVNFRLR